MTQHKAKKRIFYVRTDCAAENLSAGGSVAHTLGVIQGFIKQGHQVLCASCAMIQLLKGVGLKHFLVLKQSRMVSIFGFRITSFLSNFFFIPRCLFFLKKKKIDCVYQRYGPFNFTGLAVAWFKKVPLALEFNGSEVWVDQNWSGKKWFRLFFLIRAIEHWNLRFATHIVVVSQALKDFLVDAGVQEKKILVNPNGVDVDVFDAEKLTDTRKKIRTSFDLQNRFVFGFIGSFDLWHGIETIAAMIPEVIKKHPRAHFLLIGSGQLLPYLKKELAQKNIGTEFVTLTGTVLQRDAKNYLAACDAFLSPTKPNKDGSRFFGSPTKMFEYMSLGKPIIASDLEQLSELLHPALKQEDFEKSFAQQVGILVPPHDVKDFIAAACGLVALEEKKRATLGRNARKKAKENYSWDMHTKKIMQFVFQEKNCTQV